jgi:CDP-glucose 4,6-dehydratase
MISRTPSSAAWKNRSVIVTGHTGFKGSWLTRWLAALGAEVHGLALGLPTEPSLFDTARVASVMASDRRVDIRDRVGVLDVMVSADPSVVFHLAAQPLVRDGYRRPIETLETNALGTANVLDATRRMQTVGAVVIVTTDKVYLPKPGHLLAHSEGDELGAVDPYGWSKVMAEQIVSAFRSLPAIDDSLGWSTPIATARAGNVLGGGDWSSERLVPDCIRSFSKAEPVTLRFPEAVRPWQHVLDPLNGYLLLAEELLGPQGRTLPDSLNFGPSSKDERTVGEVARRMAELWGTGAEVGVDLEGDAPHENAVLRLDSTLARETLGWTPVWDLEQTLSRTVDWYRRVAEGADGAEIVEHQIADFVERARA